MHAFLVHYSAAVWLLGSPISGTILCGIDGCRVVPRAFVPRAPRGGRDRKGRTAGILAGALGDPDLLALARA